jgi:GAG-pre-integrase domain
MTDQINAFESDPRVNELGRRRVKVGGGSLCIRGRGTVSIKLARSKMRLHNTLFVPNLGASLVSSSRIVPKGFYAVHDDKLYIVMRCSDNQVTFQAERLNNDSLWTAIWAANDIADQTEEAYPANETVGADMNDRHQIEAEFDESRLYQMGTSKARTFQEYNKWHCHLGHINGRKLRYLHEVSNLPNAIPAKSPIKYKCNACNTAKAKKNQNHELLERAKQPLDLVSADICGQFPTSKHWDERYFLEAINNYTRHSVLFTGKTRANCAKQMFEWKKTAETQINKRLKAIRIDNALELESRALI